MKLRALALAASALSFASLASFSAFAADPPGPAQVAAPKAAPTATPDKKKTALRAQPAESERAADKKTDGATKPHAAKLASGKRSKKEKAKPPCFSPTIEIMRGTEGDRFSLTKCDGTLAPAALEHLSVLARPGSAGKPDKAWTELAKMKGINIAAGIRRVDAGLAARLETVIAHFTKDGKTPRMEVISGYRPASVGSFHANGRALDFHVDGVSNEALVSFCKTLNDTGCGYYPNSSFIHMDVRPPGTGHVQWIDASGPGETPHYVSAWPVPPEPVLPSVNGPVPVDGDLPPLPGDEHPSDPGAFTRPTELPFDPGGPSDFDAKNGEADGVK
ncbi:MAG: DUF882 domain-containing protein [Polyangiaceae bacterium]